MEFGAKGLKERQLKEAELMAAREKASRAPKLDVREQLIDQLIDEVRNYKGIHCSNL